MTVLRLSALVIVLVTAIGLYKKAWLPEKHCIRAGFFVYYTHLSNLLILLYELALGASGHDPHCGTFRWLSSPGVALSMTLCIYVTHLIYAFVLLPTAHRRDDESWLKGRFSFGNVCVHFITPGLTVLQWLLWQGQGGGDGGARGLVAGAAAGVFCLCHAAGRDRQAYRTHRPTVPLSVFGLSQAGGGAVLAVRHSHPDVFLWTGVSVCGDRAFTGIELHV